MVARIIEQQQAICTVLLEDSKDRYRMPSDSEFSVMEAIVKVLEPLSYFTDALSGEKHVTVSAVNPLLQHILTSIVAPLPGDSRIVKEMKKVIYDDLQSRYTDPSVVSLLEKCSFLDPRFRCKYLSDKDVVVSEISQEAIEFLKSDVPSPVRVAPGSDHHSDYDDDNPPPPPPRKKGLSAVLKKCLGASTSTTDEDLSCEQKAEREVQRYLDYPSCDLDMDPLEWWRAEQKRLPALASLASKYLCVCGTSVPSERLFSKAGLIVNNLRNRLSPEHVDTLLFLANNMP